MSLRTGLIVGLWLVTALVFAATVAWTMAESLARGERQLEITLARTTMMMGRNYRMSPDEPIAQHVRRTTMDVMQVLAPGTCVVIEEARISRRMFCADWQVLGPIAPRWFRDLQSAIPGIPAPLAREGRRNLVDSFRVEVSFDPVAFATTSWAQVRLAVRQALAMAAGVLVLGTALILGSTRPVQPTVAVLGALSEGRLGERVRPGGFEEFRRIARAVNRLGERLERSEEDRRALMRRLLAVEDIERKSLARDLHDEFGQLLTATRALASGIERRATRSDPDLGADARLIGSHIGRMMETLRGAFARLRPPELDDLGLVPSLRQMLSGWQAACGGQVRFELDASGFDAAGVAPDVALGLYRIVQEAITNAVRHGAPTRVEIVLGGGLGKPLFLSIEDDGGGRPSAPAGRGHGILGIAERVEAMGGRLDAGLTLHGFRVQVEIPPVQSAAA